MKNILLLLIVSLFALTSCTQTDTTKESSIPFSGGSNNHSVIVESYKETLEKASSKIKDSPEFSKCMDQNINMCIQTAGNEIAQATKSTEACKDLPNKDQQDGCILGVTIMKATTSQNKDDCADLNGIGHDQCIIAVQKLIALTKKDTKLCEPLAQAKNMGTSINMQHGPTNYDQCILGILMAKTDSPINECQKISDTGLRDMCINTLRSTGTASSPKGRSAF